MIAALMGSRNVMPPSSGPQMKLGAPMRESVQPHEEKLKGNGPVPSSAGPAALPSQEFVPSRQPESPSILRKAGPS